VAAKPAPDSDKKPPPTRSGDGIEAATEPSLKGSLELLGYTVTGAPAVSDQLGMKTTAITFKKGSVAGALTLYRSKTGEHLDALAKCTPIATGVRSGNTVVVVRMPGDAAARQAIIDEIRNGK